MTTIPPILCFDVESNGLAGEAFCVGAVVLDANGHATRTFLARCPLPDPVPWVCSHVLPALLTVPETHGDFVAMGRAFATWMLRMQPDMPGVLVVADCGWPVDTRFLHAVMDLQGAYPPWAPFPLHEVGTLLLTCGLDPTGSYPDLASEDAVARALAHPRLNKHHPLYDATQSALVARACLRRLRGGSR